VNLRDIRLLRRGNSGAIQDQNAKWLEYRDNGDKVNYGRCVMGPEIGQGRPGMDRRLRRYSNTLKTGDDTQQDLAVFVID
jgi:hypothetical protein